MTRKPRPRPAPTTPPGPTSPGRLWAFRLVTALGVPLLVLGLAEAGLRLAGFGSPAGFTLPCRVQGQAARCENPAFAAQFFPPGLARTPTPFAIPEAKAPGTFRIFVLGESAAQGDPDPTFGLGRFLQAMLEEAFPAGRFEVFDTGVPAISSHVILPIAREVAGLEGDLFVVYAGNNEVVGPFGSGTVLRQALPGLALVRAAIRLRATRVGQVLARVVRLGAASQAPREWRGMEMFLGQQVAAADPRMAAVYRSFGANLADVFEAATSSGAGVVVSTVGSRLRGCAPFASLHRPGLPADALAGWEEAFRDGVAAEARGACPEALAAYGSAAALDAEHAGLQYRTARCLWLTGDRERARAAFARARDLDALRFRADSRENEIIRTVAGAAGPRVRLVDAVAAFDAAGGGAAGGESFYEHVHLTPEGNHLLAAALFPAVAAALPAAWRGTTTPAAPSLAACARRLALTGFDRWRVARELLVRLARPPFTAQADHAEQVAELERLRDEGAREDFAVTEAAYREALARRDGDPWLHFNHAVLLDTRDVFLARRGRPDPGSAIPEYRRALELLPQLPAAHLRLAEALARVGRPEEAVAQCRALLAFRPGEAAAWLSMANALAVAGRMEEALAANRRAVALDPAAAAEAVRWTRGAAASLRQAGRAREAEALEREASALEAGGGRAP